MNLGAGTIILLPKILLVLRSLPKVVKRKISVNFSGLPVGGYFTAGR